MATFLKLSACPRLPVTPENATWYRAIQPQFLPTALNSSSARSRFNPGPLLGTAKFDLLYFAEDPQAALFEVQAMLGSPYVPGGAVANPRRTFTIINAMVLLNNVCDLTDVAAQQMLQTDAQHLTGDWEGYQFRGPPTPITAPSGVAPTQELGEALYRAGVEGFRSISAKVPHVRTLIVFPQNLLAGSNITYVDPRTKLPIRRVAAI
jgi:RES domain